MTSSVKGLEIDIIDAKSRRKTVELSSNAVYENGRFKGSRDILRDITEKKIIINSRNVGHITNDKGVHLIRNNTDRRCVTLHLYAPVIKKCFYYESLDCIEKCKTLSFNSIGGVLQ